MLYIHIIQQLCLHFEFYELTSSKVGCFFNTPNTPSLSPKCQIECRLHCLCLNIRIQFHNENLHQFHSAENGTWNTVNGKRFIYFDWIYHLHSLTKESEPKRFIWRIVSTFLAGFYRFHALLSYFFSLFFRNI